jgi:hypothetical protein
VLNVFVPEVSLQGPCVVSSIRQCVAAGVAKQVRMNTRELRMTSTASLVRKLVGEDVNPVNFRRFGKEVACLGFFHQSRRYFAI